MTKICWKTWSNVQLILSVNLHSHSFWGEHMLFLLSHFFLFFIILGDEIRNKNTFCITEKCHQNILFSFPVLKTYHSTNQKHPNTPNGKKRHSTTNYITRWGGEDHIDALAPRFSPGNPRSKRRKHLIECSQFSIQRTRHWVARGLQTRPA